MEPATPTKAAAEPEPEPKSPEETVVASAQSSLELIERSVTTKEQRFFSRAMRQTAGARKKMSPAAIKAVLGCLPESELKQLCLDRVAAAPAGVRRWPSIEPLRKPLGPLWFREQPPLPSPRHLPNIVCCRRRRPARTRTKC